MATRDDFPMPVKEALAKRVALVCSRPGCGQVTAGPQAEPTGVINVGVAAHITAAAPDGPRYDPTLTSEERRSIDNGLWLCQTCAKLVDSDTTRYAVEVLRAWRQSAEARALADLERRPDLGRDPRFEKAERLVPKLLVEMRADLKQNPLKRKCVLLKKSWSYWGDGTEFAYYYDDHEQLEAQFQVLENNGLVFNVTTGSATKYQFAEDLVDYLSGSGVDDGA